MVRRLCLSVFLLACNPNPREEIPSTPYVELCGLQGAGTYWLEEGETLEVTLSCQSGLALTPENFQIASLPTGAIFDAVANTLRWTPTLEQAAVYEIALQLPAQQESAILKIGVADAFDNPSNVPIVDPTRYTEEFGLPVIHLQPAAPLGNEFYTPTTIISRGHSYLAEAKLRGASALFYPKNSYTLKFAKEDKFNEPLAAENAFLEKRKVTLTSTFDDNSYIRQRLAFTLWNKLSPAHLQIQNYSAVVYRNGEFLGLYAVTDHVDGFLMEDHGYSQAGNLYKAIDHDGNFRLTSVQTGAPKVTPHQGYEKKEGVLNDFSDIDALVTFVDQASDADFSSQIESLVELQDFEDWWIFVSLIQADDSAGKNSYLYHDPIANTRWRYIPWDFNDSFGQTWFTGRKDFNVHPEEYTWANNIFERLLDDLGLGNSMRTRFVAALENQYKLSDVLALVDKMLAEVHDVALRDERRWAAEYQSYDGWNFRTDFLAHEEEASYLRHWIINRWNFAATVYEP